MCKPISSCCGIIEFQLKMDYFPTFIVFITVGTQYCESPQNISMTLLLTITETI